jgi:hypothetical protein
MAITEKTKQTIVISNGETGEIIEREMTADEIADYAEMQTVYAELETANQAKAAARASALAKLADLGLTAEEIAAL